MGCVLLCECVYVCVETERQTHMHRETELEGNGLCNCRGWQVQNLQWGRHPGDPGKCWCCSWSLKAIWGQNSYFLRGVLAAQSCPTLCDPMDCSSPGSSVLGILQARILEWVAISFSRGSFWPRDWTWVSCITWRFFIVWATREAYIISYFKATLPNGIITIS